MAYWIKILAHWWGYVGNYVAISIIGTAIMGFLVTENPDGLVSMVERVSSEPGNPKGAVFLLSLIALGPLFNVYTAVIAAKSAIEADDDYHWQLKQLTHLSPPSPGKRRLAIASLTIVPGLLLLPFTFWMYTAQIEWLWQADTPIYNQTGIFCALAIVFLVYAVVPRIFPSAVDAAFELEDKVTDRLSKG